MREEKVSSRLNELPVEKQDGWGRACRTHGHGRHGGDVPSNEKEEEIWFQ